MHTPHYYIDYILYTLLIISHEVAEYKHDLHTPVNAQRLQPPLCTLLINLLDAHSSLFHQLLTMHTPDYLQGTVNSALTMHSPD